MYASFVQEMTAVQEAFDTWKASKKIDDLEDVSLPTVSMVEVATMEKSPRFMGEVGYYRTWTISNKKPEKVSITSNPGDFKTAYSSELVFYPAGVQDLYYLDNKVLDIKTNKKYIIDAQNSMIYSVSGANIGGIEVHSLHMAQMIRGGATDTPQFAEAEGDGGGNIVYAGSEYYMDKEGHYLDANGNIVDESEKIINPYGFKIIADVTNDNIYKLYNNGDLYGKGVKGPLLNTPEEEMEKINPYKWTKLTIPSVIPGYNTDNIQVVMGSDTIYVIDSNKDLWAWGDNGYNKLGLNDYQLKEYTGMEATKLNIGGSYDENNNIIGSKKVYKVFPTGYATFVITETNGVYELYSSGYNIYGELGTGEQVTSSDKFKKVDFEHPENIENVCGDNLGANIIVYNDNGKLRLYYSGYTNGNNAIGSAADMIKFFKDTEYKNQNITKFIEINDGTIGSQDSIFIKKCFPLYDSNVCPKFAILGSDGNVYVKDLVSFKKIEVELSDGVITELKGAPWGFFVFKKESLDGTIEYYGWRDKDTSIGVINFAGKIQEPFLLNEYFPDGISGSDIIDFDVYNKNCLLFLTEKGEVFGCGNFGFLGINRASGFSNGFEKSNTETLNFVRFLDSNSFSECALINDNGDIYCTGDKKILFREEILQQNWELVAHNVRKFKANSSIDCLSSNSSSSVAYIDTNYDLWVAGSDSWVLGLNTEVSRSQPNFVRLKDVLQDTEIFNHIDGKVKDYYFSNYKMYILTNDSDENSLYVSGHYLDYAWDVYSYLGTGREENCIIPTFVMKNVEDVLTFNEDTVTLVRNGENLEIWNWGCCDGGRIGSRSFVPVKWESATEFIKNSEKVELLGMKYTNTYIGYIKDGKYHIATSGRNFGNSVNGVGKDGVSLFVDFDIDNLSKVEKFSIR